MATAAEPAFHDVLEEVWGRRWGAHDETGVLRSVLVRPPSRGLARIRADAWDEEAQALVDPEGRWYWTDRRPPDLDRLAAQHRGLVHALVDEGVDVVVAPPMDDAFTKAVYVRDPLVTVPGGAIIGRMAVLMRRGEEADLSRVVAGAGMPVLGTMTGTATLEGGSFVKLRDGVAALGTSIRCNDEAADALRDVLGRIGWELVVVPLPGYTIHLDMHLAMLDVDLALVGRRRAAVHVPDAPGRDGHRPGARRARGGLGAEPARARAAPRAHGGGQSGDDGPPARCRRRGAHRRLRRDPPQRRRRALLDDGAGPRPGSGDAPRTRPRCPGRSGCGRRGGSPSRRGWRRRRSPRSPRARARRAPTSRPPGARSSRCRGRRSGPCRRSRRARRPPGCPAA